MLMLPPTESQPVPSDLSDRALLGAYVTRRDEQAFAGIVGRYGPVVMGVCRRVLRKEQDAQDAFQATFLVLAMKASKVKGEFLGTWLYSVATRTSLRLRAQERKRSARERRFMRLSGLGGSVKHRDIESEISIDEQIERLPGKYREVVVRCLAQGMSKSEAAAELGWPEGTVSSRLHQARQVLRRRLEKAGFGTSATAVIGTMATPLPPGEVPRELSALTINAAGGVVGGKVAISSITSKHVLVLAKGVSKAMWVARMKIVAAVVLGPTVLTIAALLVQMHVATPPGAAADTRPAKPLKPLSPEGEVLIARLAAQEARLKNLMVVGETWEEVSSGNGLGPWKRDVAYTSVTAWYEGLPSKAARVDFHRRVSHWLESRSPYFESSTTIAFDGNTGTYIYHNDGLPGQVHPVRKATLLGALEPTDFSGASFAAGTVFSIYRDPKMSRFLGDHLRDVLDKRPGNPMAVTEEDFDGVRAVRLTFGTEEKAQESWWFDPARGMAQLRYRMTSAPPGARVNNIELRVTKLSEVSPSVWYPLEAVREQDDHYSGQATSLKGQRRRDHYVAKRVVANDPNFDRSVFKPAIPEGYAVTDRSRVPGPTTMMGTR